jgi:hypothetical protein
MVNLPVLLLLLLVVFVAVLAWTFAGTVVRRSVHARKWRKAASGRSIEDLCVELRGEEVRACVLAKKLGGEIGELDIPPDALARALAALQEAVVSAPSWHDDGQARPCLNAKVSSSR